MEKIKIRFYTDTDTIRDLPTECLIDGKRMIYDAMSSGTLTEAKKFYSKNVFEYLGEGNIIYIDGKIQDFGKTLYFFKYTNENLHLRRNANRYY